MAKKQTRRSISYSRADYEAAQAAAARDKVPLAQLAAEALHEYLERRSARERATGRVARAPFTVADVKQAVVNLHEVKPGDDGMVMVPIDSSSSNHPAVELIEGGLNRMYADLQDELRAADDVQVMYDEDVQARKQAAARRRR